MQVPEVKFVSKDNEGKPVHQYYFNDLEIPSLTYILKSTGFSPYNGVSKEVMQDSAEFGDDVHLICQLYDEDNPDPSNLPSIEEWALTLDNVVEEQLSYAAGWVKFRKHTQFRPILIEREMSCRLNDMLFGMRIDRVGESVLGPGVYELKTTAKIMPSHSVQTAAQAIPFEKDNPRRFVIQLLPNDYREHEYKERSDKRDFSYALACTWARWNRGIR